MQLIFKFSLEETENAQIIRRAGGVPAGLQRKAEVLVLHKNLLACRAQYSQSAQLGSNNCFALQLKALKESQNR